MPRGLVLAAGLVVLAAAAAAGEPAKSTLLLQADRTNTGAPIAYPRTDAPEITTMIVEIAPGASTARRSHPYPTHGYVLEGSLEVVAEGGTRNRYEAGDAFLETVGTVHQGFNVGQGPLRILVTYIGVMGEANTQPAE
jgi:quercetin dioxygenase-like cupin family protein